MAKPSVYVPDHWMDALGELYPDVPLSQLVRAGLVHVIARGPVLTPSDELRALITVEQQQPHPNRSWIRAARHALHTRHAGRFLEVAGPPPGVSS